MGELVIASLTTLTGFPTLVSVSGWEEPTHYAIGRTAIATLPCFDSVCPRTMRSVVGNTIERVDFLIGMVADVFLLVSACLIVRTHAFPSLTTGIRMFLFFLGGIFLLWEGGF